jgi:hypothetical protein
MLTYDHANAEAFLDAVRGHEKSYDGLLLCAIHSAKFSAPRGWTTVDRRPTDQLRSSRHGDR